MGLQRFQEQKKAIQPSGVPNAEICYRAKVGSLFIGSLCTQIWLNLTFCHLDSFQLNQDIWIFKNI